MDFLKQAERDAFDINVFTLEYVKKQYKLKNVTISISDSDKLPYPDGFFDIIFTADTLEHFQDSYHIQKELIGKNKEVISNKQGKGSS